MRLTQKLISFFWMFGIILSACTACYRIAPQTGGSAVGGVGLYRRRWGQHGLR
jgi:hypothetical protein